ncbi:MAG TPA: DUF2059 domain-containing protein [Candidatus Polarisedimenticolia bacterium]|nr:DUF2059 domain-containing protein [Candidatus Polarisedimenticolia bacterium]
MKMRTFIVPASLLALSAVALASPAPSAHEQAVKEMFQLMGLERAMIGGATAMIDAQIQGNPAIAPYRDVMLEWAGKYLTWEAMSPGLVKLYMETFSEAEVREMIVFYRTPTGRKALMKLPELMQKGAMIGAEVGKAHQQELEGMVLERQRQLESEKKP